MEKNMFKIDVTNLSWINGAADDKHDLCLHGDAKAIIGERTLERRATTVSATALYLLKTLTQDKKIYDGMVEMLPCCGHFMMANDDLSEVEIMGCDIGGIDWATTHIDGGVKITLSDGYEVFVDKDSYKAEVLRFADEIKAFYDACTPKEPQSEHSQKGFTAFCNEWTRRYNEATK